MKPTRLKIARYIAEQSLSGKLTKTKINDLAGYFIETGRTNDVSSIMRDVNELWAEAGVIEVQTLAAHKLSPELRAEIKGLVKKIYPKARQIAIMEQIDPGQIGGLKLEFANQQLDLSVRTEIDKFKQVALAGRD